MTLEALIAKDDADSRHGGPVYLPSVEDIASECAAIQAGWSPEERQARERGLEFRAGNLQRSYFTKHRPWKVPTVRCPIGGAQ